MRKSVLLSAGFLLAATGASAGDMRYSYLQLDLQGAELGDYRSSVNGAGFAARGSLEFGPLLYGFGSYNNTNYTGGGVRVRFIPATAGLGARYVISPTLDVFGGASAEYLRIETGILGFDETNTRDSFKGWGATLGLRGWLGESFQWTFDVKHRDLEDLQKINSISLGGRYYIRRAWAVGMDYTYQKYDNFIVYARESLGSVNVRYTFGRF